MLEFYANKKAVKFHGWTGRFLLKIMLCGACFGGIANAQLQNPEPTSATAADWLRPVITSPLFNFQPDWLSPIVVEPGILDPQEVEMVLAHLRDLNKKTNHTTAVVMVETTMSVPIDVYAIGVGNEWVKSNKATSPKILILLAKNDKKAFLAVKGGADTVISDKEADSIADELMQPQINNGAYAQAFLAALDRIDFILGNLREKEAREKNAADELAAAQAKKVADETAAAVAAKKVDDDAAAAALRSAEQKRTIQIIAGVLALCVLTAALWFAWRSFLERRSHGNMGNNGNVVSTRVVGNAVAVEGVVMKDYFDWLKQLIFSDFGNAASKVTIGQHLKYTLATLPIVILVVFVIFNVMAYAKKQDFFSDIFTRSSSSSSDSSTEAVCKNVKILASMFVDNTMDSFSPQGQALTQLIKNGSYSVENYYVKEKYCHVTIRVEGNYEGSSYSKTLSGPVFP